MRLQAIIVLGNADASRVEGLVFKDLHNYYTAFEIYENGLDTIVEVYSEDEDAGEQTADYLEDNGYDIDEYIIK